MAYKIEKQTDSFYQIRHPDGSSFIVPKKGMSKDIHEKIKGLPGYAGGGDIEYPMDPRIPTPDRFNPNAGREAMQTVMSPIAVTSEDVNRANPEAITASPIQPADVLGPIAQGAIRAAPAIGRGAVELGKAIGERALANEVGSVGPDIGEIIAANQKNHLKNVKSLKASLEEYFGKELPQLKTDSSDSQYLTLNLNSKGQLVEPWEESELRPIKIRISDHNRTSPRYEGINPDINIAPGADTVETALNKLLGNKFEYNPNSFTMNSLYPNKSFSGFNESQEKINSLLKILGAKEAKKYAHGGIVGEDNSMGYRIIKDSADHYQVLHPDGTKFTVPKKGISKQMHEKIAGMPKLYDGDQGLMSDSAMERLAMVDRSNPATPFDEEIGSIESRLNAPNTMGSEEAVPLANKLAQLKTVQQSIIDAKRNPPAPEMAPDMARAPASSEIDQSAGQAPEQIQGTVPPAPEAKAVPGEAPKEEPKAPAPQAGAMPQMLQKRQTGLAGELEAVGKAQTDYESALATAQQEIDKRQEALRSYVDTADKEAEDFAASNKINPERYWQDMSTGNKIQSAVAMLLGGLGAGLTGGKNYAMEIINSAIDKDIDAQKENRNSLYNSLLNKHKRHEMALTASKADALQQVTNALNLYGAQAKTAEAKANISKIMNDVEMQKMAYKQYYQNKNAQDFLVGQGANGARLTPQEIQAMPKDERERFINGAGFASRPESAAKIREVKANADDIESLLDRMTMIRKRHSGGTALPGEVATEAQSLGQMLIGKLREPVLGPGTMQESEYKRLQSVIPTDVSAFWSTDANTIKKLDVLRDVIRNNLDNKLKSEGIRVKERPKPAAEIAIPGMQEGLMLNK